MNLSDTFSCRPRRTRLTVDECETRYCEVDASRNKHSTCYECPMGAHVRRSLALEGAPFATMIAERFAEVEE